MPFSCTAIYFGNVYETLEHDPPTTESAFADAAVEPGTTSATATTTTYT